MLNLLLFYVIQNLIEIIVLSIAVLAVMMLFSNVKLKGMFIAIVLLFFVQDLLWLPIIKNLDLIIGNHEFVSLLGTDSMADIMSISFVDFIVYFLKSLFIVFIVKNIYSKVVLNSDNKNLN